MTSCMRSSCPCENPWERDMSSSFLVQARAAAFADASPLGGERIHASNPGFAALIVRDLHGFFVQHTMPFRLSILDDRTGRESTFANPGGRRGFHEPLRARGHGWPQQVVENSVGVVTPRK